MAIKYLNDKETFERLISRMPEEQRKEYEALSFHRVETAFTNRRFIVYKMDRNDPVQLMTLKVNDFACDDTEGCTTELEIVGTGETFVVGHMPTKVPGQPIFLSIPVKPNLIYAIPEENHPEVSHSLAFPLLVRTKSRRSMRERGVVHMETNVLFNQEFGNK